MDKFKQLSPRLIQISATIAAVVVGVLQFLYRAWHSNDVGTKLKSITYRMFSVLKTISTTITDELETPSASDNVCTQKELDRLWKEINDADEDDDCLNVNFTENSVSINGIELNPLRTRKQNAEPKVG